MRNFIKNHTPEWWTGWCWFGLFMLFWSIGWAVFGNLAWTRGFQIGMAFYWIGFLVNRAALWYQCNLTNLYRDISNTKDQIILSQRREIKALKELIK